MVGGDRVMRDADLDAYPHIPPSGCMRTTTCNDPFTRWPRRAVVVKDLPAGGVHCLHPIDQRPRLAPRGPAGDQGVYVQSASGEFGLSLPFTIARTLPVLALSFVSAGVVIVQLSSDEHTTGVTNALPRARRRSEHLNGVLFASRRICSGASSLME